MNNDLLTSEAAFLFTTVACGFRVLHWRPRFVIASAGDPEHLSSNHWFLDSKDLHYFASYGSIHM